MILTMVRRLSGMLVLIGRLEESCIFSFAEGLGLGEEESPLPHRSHPLVCVCVCVWGGGGGGVVWGVWLYVHVGLLINKIVAY